MAIKIKDVVRNYYTGERWFLVDVGQGKTYISESSYYELQPNETLNRFKKTDTN